MVWKTKDGRELEISKMDTEHLVNTYKMLRRKGLIRPTTLEFYLTTCGPHGDMAQMAFEREFDAIISAPTCAAMDEIYEELKRRDVSVD